MYLSTSDKMSHKIHYFSDSGWVGLNSFTISLIIAGLIAVLILVLLVMCCVYIRQDRITNKKWIAQSELLSSQSQSQSQAQLQVIIKSLVEKFGRYHASRLISVFFFLDSSNFSLFCQLSVITCSKDISGIETY